jgi:flagellar biosynthesis activator protein FlaF
MPASKSNNPYAAAAGTYGDHAQKHTGDQRELEARVLLKSAKLLQDLQTDWDNVTPQTLEEALKYNRQIWMLFYDTALENKDEESRPNDLRSNILNLANFIFKREIEILGTPEKQKLDVLVNINREIAAGLMQRQKKEAEEAKNTSETPTETTSHNV